MKVELIEALCVVAIGVAMVERQPADQASRTVATWTAAMKAIGQPAAVARPESLSANAAFRPGYRPSEFDEARR